MNRKKGKGKHRKHFVCRWCDQDKVPPVRGITRLGRKVVICPGCRGPVK